VTTLPSPGELIAAVRTIRHAWAPTRYDWRKIGRVSPLSTGSARCTVSARYQLSEVSQHERSSGWVAEAVADSEPNAATLTRLVHAVGQVRGH